jgi:hypothetical protein
VIGGAVIGLIFPPTLLAGALVGAGVGGGARSASRTDRGRGPLVIADRRCLGGYPSANSANSIVAVTPGEGAAYPLRVWAIR